MSTKDLAGKKKESQKGKHTKKRFVSRQDTSLRRSTRKMVIEDGEIKSRFRKGLFRLFRFKK